LRGLHLEDFAEIDGAIEAHILKVAAEDADAKKSRDGKPGSEPTSPSVAP
jgi:hypothetical protein